MIKTFFLTVCILFGKSECAVPNCSVVYNGIVHDFSRLKSPQLSVDIDAPDNFVNIIVCPKVPRSYINSITLLNTTVLSANETSLIVSSQSQGLVDETTIYFECSNSSHEIPKYKKTSNYIEIFWKTPWICLKNRQKRNIQEMCLAYDRDNFKYDLTELRNKALEISSNKENKFMLRICADLENSSCKLPSSVCQDSISFGNSKSSQLYLDNLGLYLNYTDGDPCPNNKSINLSTIIKFTCDDENSYKAPVAEFPDGSCELSINFPTLLACRNQIDCHAEDLDLSVLESKSSNYEIPIENGIITSNMCRRLVPNVNLKCPDEAKDSFMCLTDSKGSKSLGRIAATPIKDSTGYEIQYHGGSPCDKTPALPLSSSIHLMCNYTAGIGQPEFNSISDDCQYIFHWPTTRVCPPSKLNFRNERDNCSFTNVQTNSILELHDLVGSSDFGNIKNNGIECVVNLCHRMPASKCDSLACIVKNDVMYPLGVASSLSTSFHYNEDMVVMHIFSGAPCGNSSKRYSSEIRLACDRAGLESKWTISNTEDCHVILHWTSPRLCFNGSPPPPVGWHSSLSRVVVVGIILGIAALLLFLTYVLRQKSFFDKLMQNRRRSRNVHYVKVGQDEAVTLLPQAEPGDDSESDVDLINS